jgi:hypothetical protein
MHLALAFYNRVVLSLQVNQETYKNDDKMSSLMQIARTMLGIYNSKGMNVSPAVKILVGTSKRFSQTAAIEVNIEHASNISIPQELEDQHWALSKDNGALVVIVADGTSTVAYPLAGFRRRPRRSVSLSAMMGNITFPQVTVDKTPFREGATVAEVDGKYYELEMPVFQLERESLTRHVRTTKGVEELEDDEDILSYLNSLPPSDFHLLTANFSGSIAL